MKLGFIGLGRMGSNIVHNLLDKKHSVVGYDRSPKMVSAIRRRGFTGIGSIISMAGALQEPRLVVIMVPAGKPVDDVLDALLPALSQNDTIIEAGNSFFEDSIRRHKRCRKLGVNFLDMGTSGGMEGARHGASLTIGGDHAVFLRFKKLFRDIAAKDGYAYVGSSGAGHFVKMVHNGIEYAMLQAYGEGFDVLHHGRYKLDYGKIAGIWSHGSIIRSYITELAVGAFRRDPLLRRFSGRIGGGETGTWTAKVAKKERVDAGIIDYAIKARKKSLRKPSFATKFVSAMRAAFGGHNEAK